MGPELEQHLRELDTFTAAKVQLVRQSAQNLTPRIPRQEKQKAVDHAATPISAYDSSTKFLGEISLLLGDSTS